MFTDMFTMNVTLLMLLNLSSILLEETTDSDKSKNQDIYANFIDYPTGFLLGYKFHPTDEELAYYYLSKKVENKLDSTESYVIQDIDASEFYSKAPDKLDSKYYENKEQFFFIHHRAKQHNPVAKIRPVADGTGFWNWDGNSKPISSSQQYYWKSNLDTAFSAIKSTLNYFRGQPSPAPSMTSKKPKKTHWSMEQYDVDSNKVAKDKCVIGRLKRGQVYYDDAA
ncbi:hypothetical protein C5167_022723 [Papaver somniferum]|uniref:NAC domain-containing protein n=1 Tax=Papaver somniferum TaxID=3469 RepID=A0A4Y7JJM8_PAPSO|nr:transcription factor JUNGBRUNNEN 1-like [Papaver somniferum]RZC60957.1 hypothetical protein C5167_022723 [Papaver somniferum]